MRLERNCSGPSDFIWQEEGRHGLQRLFARFSGHAFDPHRHETYAIGLTTAGVQSFHYRGIEHHSLAGQTIVIHPDEMHDGHAGEPRGFDYRMLYVEPALIAMSLGGRSLPFVRETVAEDEALATVLRHVFDAATLDEPLLADDIVVRLADALERRADPVRSPKRPMLPLRRLAQVREALDEAPDEELSSERLASLAGLDRHSLIRTFRAYAGTTPYRYRLGRRLALARTAIAAGEPLAEAAAAAGFADQSHMTRHFVRRFGLTPGRYARLAAAAGPRRASSIAADGCCRRTSL